MSLLKKLGSKIASPVVDIVAKGVNKLQTTAQERKNFLDSIKSDIDRDVRVNFENIAEELGVDFKNEYYGEEVGKLRDAYRKSVESHYEAEFEIAQARKEAAAENRKALKSTLKDIMNQYKSEIKDDAFMAALAKLNS